jgi:hypothetical protein
VEEEAVAIADLLDAHLRPKHDLRPRHNHRRNRTPRMRRLQINQRHNLSPPILLLPALHPMHSARAGVRDEGEEVRAGEILNQTTPAVTDDHEVATERLPMVAGGSRDG